MRKSVKQQLALRVLSTAALMAMVSSIATAAFAAEYNVKDGSVDILAANGEQRITQWEDKDNNLCVKDGEGKEIRNRLDDDIILTTKNKDTGETETTSNTVTITAEDGNTANVILKDVHIETKSSWNDSGSAPIEIKGNGDTKLELNGNNTVLSGSKNHAGIEKADVNGTGTLTIKDDLNDDNSTPKDKDENGNAVGGDTGKLVAGGYENSAGIGGGDSGTGKNIRIEGNAHVAAFSNSGAGIGSGYQSNGNSDITITDHATVEAASAHGCGIGGGLLDSGKATITISGDASVHAEALDYAAAIGSGKSSATVNIEDHADVTAVSEGVAIGTNYDYNGDSSTVINITSGTVNAVTSSKESSPAIGTVGGNLDLTINSSTGKTTVNACTTGSDPLSLNIGTRHYDSSTRKYSTSPSEGAEYNEDGSSHLGEDNAAIINSYCNTTLTPGTYDAPKTLDRYAFHGTQKLTLSDKDTDKGDLTKVVHNRKYMDENPNIDTSDLKDEDLHDWKLNPEGEYKEPTLEEDGYADYICSIDKCGQTKRVPLPKLTPKPSEPDTPSTPETPDTPDTPSTPDKPSTPDTPNTPDTPSTPDVPSTPEVTPADPAVTPDAVQADAAPADAAATPDAKPEAAPAAPAAAAALPQTGANWLAVVGSALSGLFLLAAGFVLDRKGRRMN